MYLSKPIAFLKIPRPEPDGAGVQEQVCQTGAQGQRSAGGGGGRGRQPQPRPRRHTSSPWGSGGRGLGDTGLPLVRTAGAQPTLVESRMAQKGLADLGSWAVTASRRKALLGGGQGAISSPCGADRSWLPWGWGQATGDQALPLETAGRPPPASSCCKAQ